MREIHHACAGAIPAANPRTTLMNATTSLHILTVENGIAVVTLNRPEAMNSLNTQLRSELMALLPQLDLRDDVRVIVITGAGNRAFCAGADLKERATRSTEAMVHDRHTVVAKWTSAIASMRKPVIAAINGYCMAGGFELALQCDISIASERAVFSLPEVTHGFFPGGGACQRLPRLVGIQKAKELILTGRRWDAQEAAALGMVNKVVPHDKVMEEAMALAHRIAANPPIAVIQAKSALNQSQETGVTAGLRFDNEAWVGCMHSDEWKEKLAGFVRKERKA
jgi:enoyl-CoA hydratase/carnithine racemase